MLLLNILMADRPEASTNVDLLYLDDLSVLTVKGLKYNVSTSVICKAFHEVIDLLYVKCKYGYQKFIPVPDNQLDVWALNQSGQICSARELNSLHVEQNS